MPKRIRFFLRCALLFPGSKRRFLQERVRAARICAAAGSTSNWIGVDNMAMAMSLVASTRGLAVMPAYANNLLPWSVVPLRQAGFQQNDIFSELFPGVYQAERI